MDAVEAWCGMEDDTLKEALVADAREDLFEGDEISPFPALVRLHSAT